jgi:hypothetical protein
MLQAIRPPSAGAARPSTIRLTGIRWIGRRERSISCDAASIETTTTSPSPIDPMCK